MDADEFWHLIETTTGEDPDDRTARLTERLAALPEADIQSFEVHLDTARKRLDTYALWGAASLLKGGFCSDDSFFYLQAWLIGLGRQAVERVVADPDELAELPAVRQLSGRDRSEWTDAEWPDWETLDYVALKAYFRRTGGKASLVDALEASGYQPQCGSSPDPSDEPWPFDDPAEIARRLPRLSRLFPPPPPSRS